MKWKGMLAVIVLNIFLMLALTVLLEYNNLSERFQSVEDSIQEALEMSLSASVNSEEFFSSRYQTMYMSYASGSSADNAVAAETTLWLNDSGKFSRGNTYLIAKYFEQNGRLPQTEAELLSANNLGIGFSYGQTAYIFEWLYGGVGSDYANVGWANRNRTRKKEYQATALSARGSYRSVANSNFKEYYNGVGKYQLTVGYLKRKDAGLSSYSLELMPYSTLLNMGLSWMEDSVSGVRYCDAGSSVTADNFTSSAHIGKTYGTQTGYTLYFLTPASLGVTYVPVEVLKPVFVANLDAIVRLNKLAQANLEGMSESDMNAVLASATGCMPSQVYDYNTDSDRYESGASAGGGYVQHRASYSGQIIVNDGLVEYDLSSAQVKVDYFYMDLGVGSLRDSASKVISRVNGVVAGTDSQDVLRRRTLDLFLARDSGLNVVSLDGTDFAGMYEEVRNGRIIARVSVKVKVHVPYQSGLMQWMAYMFTGTNHFDIKMFNEDTGLADVTQDGIWYQYTTYYCTSRS